MKMWMLSVLIGMTSLATAAPITGRLELTNVDGNTAYRCQLAGGKGYVIQVGLNTDQRLLSVQLGGDLARPEGANLKFVGPYTEWDLAEPAKAPKKGYDVSSRGYDLVLIFTDGKAMPVLTLRWGARELNCF